ARRRAAPDLLPALAPFPRLCQGGCLSRCRPVGRLVADRHDDRAWRCVLCRQPDAVSPLDECDRMTCNGDQEAMLPRRLNDDLRHSRTDTVGGSAVSRRTLVAGMGAVRTLSACGQVSYTKPQEDVAEAFARDSPARHAGSNTWWRAFRDPQLDELI